VAKFFGVNPREVEQWPNPYFLDAVEYIELCMESDARQAEENEIEYGD
jgi:hypothetical protein